MTEKEQKYYGQSPLESIEEKAAVIEALGEMAEAFSIAHPLISDQCEENEEVKFTEENTFYYGLD